MSPISGFVFVESYTTTNTGYLVYLGTKCLLTIDLLSKYEKPNVMAFIYHVCISVALRYNSKFKVDKAISSRFFFFFIFD